VRYTICMSYVLEFRLKSITIYLPWGMRFGLALTLNFTTQNVFIQIKIGTYYVNKLIQHFFNTVYCIIGTVFYSFLELNTVFFFLSRKMFETTFFENTHNLTISITINITYITF